MICDDCIHKIVCAKVYSDDWCAFKQTTETINAIIIPDNATNGDMIKALFPGTTGMGFDAQLNFEMHLDNEHNYHVGKFNQDWWNEPYVYKENK